MNNIEYNKIAMSENETNCFIKYLNANDTLFEWGSGASTFNFCTLVKELYSVENNFAWYNDVNKTLKERNLNNVKVFYAPEHEIKYDDVLDKQAEKLLRLTDNVIIKNNVYYSECRGNHDWHCHIDYINTIQHVNKTFSKVFIDGRARVFCAYKALDFINEDSIVYIHDFFRRNRYHSVLDYYYEIDRCESLVILKKIIK
jgi:hypothetical protein